MDVLYWDQAVKRQRLLHGDPETLRYIPPWMEARLRHFSDEHAARISLSGPQDLDVFEASRAIAPARTRFPTCPRSARSSASGRRTGACRLRRRRRGRVPSTPTPTRTRRTACSGMRSRTSAASMPTIPLRPGTPGSRRSPKAPRSSPRDGSTRSACTGRAPISRSACSPPRGGRRPASTTIDGLHHFPNIPSEETFTTPDPMRVDGYVSATMPLEYYGSILDGDPDRVRGGARGQDRRRRQRGHAQERVREGRRRHAPR